MVKLKFKRFSKAKVVKQIWRGLLGKFFDRFKDDLAASGIQLPGEDSGDDEYYSRMAEILQAPEGLPEQMVEALFAIDELADHGGQYLLENAVEQAGIPLLFRPDSTHAEIALQVWLADPGLVKEKHYKRQLVRLSLFEYYDGRPAEGKNRVPSQVCHEVMDLLKQDLDIWFAEHNRGEQMAKIELQEMDGEQWFLIRHGDTFTRTAKMENKRMEMLHFRPAKDDVVVYSPEHDELRIHAGTQGEKELYRMQFGRRLHGDEQHFQAHRTYTLEPLREYGVESLDTEGIEGIEGIVLREFEIAWDSRRKESLVRKSVDIFGIARERNWNAIPKNGQIQRAVFDVYFQGAAKPRRVQIQTPNILKLGRQCDAPRVHRWLRRNGFRGAESMDHRAWSME